MVYHDANNYNDEINNQLNQVISAGLNNDINEEEQNSLNIQNQLDPQQRED